MATATPLPHDYIIENISMGKNHLKNNKNIFNLYIDPHSLLFILMVLVNSSNLG